MRGVELADEAQRRDLTVVLVSPQIPGNTGTIARTCAATQVPLHLVGPLGFTLEDAQLKRAGLDYWSSVCVRVHADWEAFHVYWRHERGAPGRGLPDFARHVIGYRFTQACMSLDDAAGTFCSVLPRGASWPSPSSARGRTRRRGRTAPATGCCSGRRPRGCRTRQGARTVPGTHFGRSKLNLGQLCRQFRFTRVARAFNTSTSSCSSSP